MMHKHSRKHNINTSNMGFIPSSVFGADQFEKDSIDHLDDTPVNSSENVKNTEDPDDKFNDHPTD